MKKYFAILLALGLIVSLAACGIPTGSEIKEPANITIDDQNENMHQDEQAEESEISLDNMLEEIIQDELTDESNVGEVTISETVLVDESGVKITAKSIKPDELFGPEITLFIENNSGKDLTFQCRNASVNGYMIGTMMSVDVVNGKSANDSLTFVESDLEACGIEAIADIELSFHVFDMADWETYLDTEPIQIQTSIADNFVYTYDDSGELAYEGNDVKIVIKGLAENDSIFGPSIVVYIENNGDKDVTVQTRGVSINGFMVEPMFSCDVAAGKRAVNTITFMETELEENGITAIENVELSFHVFDFENWDTIVDTEVVKIEF